MVWIELNLSNHFEFKALAYITRSKNFLVFGLMGCDSFLYSVGTRDLQLWVIEV